MVDSGVQVRTDTPVRPVWLQVLVLAMLFLGGGALGAGLAVWLAPESILAQFVGLFSFAVPFLVSMHLWLGLAVAVAIWRTFRRGPRSPRDARKEIPGGSIVFVPACAGLAAVAGLLIGVFGSSIGVIGTFGLYLLLGTVYGAYCWLFARSGYLPFPHE